MNKLFPITFSLILVWAYLSDKLTFEESSFCLAVLFFVNYVLTSGNADDKYFFFTNNKEDQGEQ
jgi:hypothetical protein